MVTSDEEQKLNHTQTTQFPVAFSFIMQFFLLLAGYQILSEVELDKAGIKHERYRSE